MQRILQKGFFYFIILLFYYFILSFKIEFRNQNLQLQNFDRRQITWMGKQIRIIFFYFNLFFYYFLFFIFFNYLYLFFICFFLFTIYFIIFLFRSKKQLKIQTVLQKCFLNTNSRLLMFCNKKVILLEWLGMVWTMHLHWKEQMLGNLIFIFLFLFLFLFLFIFIFIFLF